MTDELSVAGQVKAIERRKEIERIEKELKRFSTINEINRAFSQRLDPQQHQDHTRNSILRTRSPTPVEGGQNYLHAAASTTRAGEKHQKHPQQPPHAIPVTYEYFERFFTIKQRIMDEEQKAKIKALIEADTKAAMAEVLYQQHERYVYNIKLDDSEPRLTLFLGEAGKLVRARFNQIVYQGGFMGTTFNERVGKFRQLLRQVGPEEQKIEYEGIHSDDKERELGRMGHLAFIDEPTGHLVIFGGQRKGD